MKRSTQLLAGLLAVLTATALTVMAAKEGAAPAKEGAAPPREEAPTAISPTGDTIKGKQIKLTGDLSCTFCRFAHPDRPCKKGCCAECVKAGDPALLTDREGQMYILVTNEIKKQLMTPARVELLGGKVDVKGLLVKGKGIQVIFVESLEKAS